MSRSPDPFDHGQASVRYVPSPRAEAETVRARLARGWQLGAIHAVESHARASRANSRVFRCTTETGRYVLRRSLRNDAARCEQLEHLAAWLRERGLPVPRTVPTREGLPCQVEDGAVHTLVAYIAGEHFDGSRAELTEVAVLLAGLHAELARCPLRAAFEARAEPYPWAREEIEDLLTTARRGQRPFDREADRYLERLQQAEWSGPEGLDGCPRQLGHFDLNPHNLLFDPQGRVVALLDLDLVHVAERARDVAIAMHKHARVFGARTERAHDPDGSLIERARLFVESYRARTPLGPEEIRALPFFAFDEARRRILYILRRHYRDGDVSSDFDLAKQATQLEEARGLSGAFAEESAR